VTTPLNLMGVAFQLYRTKNFSQHNAAARMQKITRKTWRSKRKTGFTCVNPVSNP